MSPSDSHILILEDEALVALTYRDYFQSRDIIADTASTLREAYRYIKQKKYKFIVCDHDLPDGKGLQLLKKLQELEIDTPVFYMSAAPKKILEQVNHSPLVKKVLTKPVSNQELEQIAQLVSSKQQIEIIPKVKLISKKERESLMGLFDQFLNSTSSGQS